MLPPSPAEDDGAAVRGNYQHEFSKRLDWYSPCRVHRRQGWNAFAHPAFGISIWTVWNSDQCHLPGHDPHGKYTTALRRAPRDGSGASYFVPCGHLWYTCRYRGVRSLPLL